MPERYFRFEGIDIGESTPNALKAKIGGVWVFVPKSVVHDFTRKHATGQDELIVHEWWARERGYMA